MQTGFALYRIKSNPFRQSPVPPCAIRMMNDSFVKVVGEHHLAKDNLLQGDH